jgi:hypothetical protein
MVAFGYHKLASYGDRTLFLQVFDNETAARGGAVG